MSYKEKYEAALERARKELLPCDSLECDTAKNILAVFPELAESKSEKIMRTLIEFFGKYPDQEWKEGLLCKDVVDWIEGQKDVINANDILTTFHNYVEQEWNLSETPRVKEELDRCFGRLFRLPWTKESRMTIPDLLTCAAHFYALGKSEREEEERKLNGEN